MKHTTLLTRRVFGLSLLGALLSGGCALKAPSPGSDLSHGKALAAVYVLRDSTTTVQRSETVTEADAYVSDKLTRLLRDAQRQRFGVRAEIFTSPPPGQSVGASRHHIEWAQKPLTPRESGKQLADHTRRLLALFHQLEQEAPIRDESAILENLADLIRRLSEIPEGDNADRTCVVISDMEEFRADFVTTAQITSASDAQLAKILDRVRAQYPAVPKPPQKVIFVITTPAQRTSEIQRTRLRTFWEKVCQNWGIRDVEFVNPPSQSVGGHGPVPQKADTSSGSALQETPQGARQPTLTVSNGTPYPALFTLVSTSDNAEHVYDLPGNRTSVLTVPEGHFRWRLEYPGKEMGNSLGRCWFRPFCAYKSGFVQAAHGGALSFGEAE